MDEFQYIGFVLKLVELIAKGVGALGAWRHTDARNRILDYLIHRPEPATRGIIYAHVFIKPLIEDVPFRVGFPPAERGWVRFKWELKRLPYEVRHRWRKVVRNYIPEKRVLKILTQLTREREIIYNPHNERYSWRN